MLNRNQMLALGAAGALSLFTLVSCSAKSPQASVPADAGTAADTSTLTDTSTLADTVAPATGSGFGEMSTQVTTAKTAVEAGKFDEAKTAMDKVEEAWKTVEDDLKKADATAYDAIEVHMDEANGELKKASPDAAIVTEHLDLLATTISGVPQ